MGRCVGFSRRLCNVLWCFLSILRWITCFGWQFPVIPETAWFPGIIDDFSWCLQTQLCQKCCGAFVIYSKNIYSIWSSAMFLDPEFPKPFYIPVMRALGTSFVLMIWFWMHSWMTPGWGLFTRKTKPWFRSFKFSASTLPPFSRKGMEAGNGISHWSHLCDETFIKSQ